MDADPAIGSKIRMRRQELDMTQQELGSRVGVDRASIANWEHGKHYPLRYIHKLERVLGISLAAAAPAADDDDDEDIRQLEAQAAEIIAVTRRMRAERERRAAGRRAAEKAAEKKAAEEKAAQEKEQAQESEGQRRA